VVGRVRDHSEDNITAVADHRLSAGDSVLYDAARAPRWTALGGARAQFLLMSLRIL
jgi:hypothetical protein